MGSVCDTTFALVASLDVTPANLFHLRYKLHSQENVQSTLHFHYYYLEQKQLKNTGVARALLFIVDIYGAD